jgi:hypothetical protein
MEFCPILLYYGVLQIGQDVYITNARQRNKLCNINLVPKKYDTQLNYLRNLILNV